MTAEEINIISSLKWPIIRSIRLHRTIDYRDVLQELYIKIINHYEKFTVLTDQEKLGYAYRVMKNLLIDMHRERNYKKRSGKTINLFINEQNDTHTSLMEKERAFDLIELNEAIQKLRKHSFGEELKMLASGYTVKEIAEIKQVNVNTILSRCYQARKFLRA